jgi:hypothetical protein
MGYEHGIAHFQQEAEKAYQEAWKAHQELEKAA